MNIKVSKITHLKVLIRILNAHTESRDLIQFILSRPEIDEDYKAFLRDKFEEYNAKLIPDVEEKITRIEKDISRLHSAAMQQNQMRKRELELLIAGEEARLSDEERSQTSRKCTLMFGSFVFCVNCLKSVHQKRQSRKRIQRAQAELAVLNNGFTS